MFHSMPLSNIKLFSPKKENATEKRKEKKQSVEKFLSFSLEMSREI